MNYTKGEWEVDRHTVYALGKYGSNRFSAHIQHGWDGGEETPQAELEANAHLISAAPELYEALKALTSYVSIMGYFKPEKQEQFRKALAKAEGK